MDIPCCEGASYSFVLNASPDCSFAERSQCESGTARVRHSWGLEGFGQPVFWTMPFEADYFRRPGSDWSSSIFERCRAQGQRHPHRSCASSESSSNTESLRSVVFGRGQCCRMGRPKLWWWQLFSPRSAQECTAGSGHTPSICCDPGRWICRDMGRSRTRWWQLFSPRSAQECTAGSGHKRSICCDPGRWICRDMGLSRIRWWQLFSPRSAQECTAGSGHTRSICGDPGRWICRDMGRSRLWWWQLFSPRSAQECAAGSGHMVCICCHPGRWICRDMGQSK